MQTMGDAVLRKAQLSQSTSLCQSRSSQNQKCKEEIRVLMILAWYPEVLDGYHLTG